MKAVMLTNKNNEVMKTLYHSSLKIHVISALLWAPLVYYIYTRISINKQSLWAGPTAMHAFWF